MTPQGTRMEDLEKRFSQLEGSLQDSPEKQAISILHAMLQEISRPGAKAGGQSGGHEQKNSEKSLEDIANLYRSAPAMEGHSEQDGLVEGSSAPDFQLPDAQGKLVSLHDFRGKNVVLVFYPLDWSPACSDQLSLYQMELEEFEKHNAVVIGISVDSIYSHGAWAAVRDITFPLLADFHPKGEVAQKYRIMRDRDGFSERALFLIDPDGKICYKTVSNDISNIPDIYELFDQLSRMGEKK